MAEKFESKVSIAKSTRDPSVTISLDATSGNVTIGGHGTNGKIRLAGTTGENHIQFLSNQGAAYFGGSGKDGKLQLFAADGKKTVGIDSKKRQISLQGVGSNKDRIRLDGTGGNGWFGGNGKDGDLVLFAATGDNKTLSKATLHLNGAKGGITFRNDEGDNRIRLDADGGNGWFGGNGKDGDLVLFAATGDNKTQSKATLHLDGAKGRITIRNDKGANRIRLDADGGNGWFGGNGKDGDLVLFAATGDNKTREEATIHLDGGEGDIILRNADFAEDFDIAKRVFADVVPGTVMILDEDGNLIECESAYDKRVAGVISGAGLYKPGILMDKQEGSKYRMPVSLTGKVICKVDATYGEILPGDLLTTSPTKGHAMKATDPLQSFGAVIGKALKPFKAGCGMLPMLVTRH